MKAKFSGSDRKLRPAPGRLFQERCASRRLADTSGPEVICIAETRGMAGTMGLHAVPAMASSETANGKRAHSARPASSAHDIELIDAVEALDLQADGQADLGLELAEGAASASSSRSTTSAWARISSSRLG